ncbi:phosphotransferase family protein [Sphingopyxis sp.]|uniref:phosphotransferase family protein n=1 Tax=Sphingopyxis sp. TaxID=1908224 RepID=UPI003D097067
MSVASATELPALLERWFSRQGIAAPRVGDMVQFPSGFSWITYAFTLQSAGTVQELILRIGPSNGLYAPYSAEPEYAALAAVQGSAVAAPRPHYWSDDSGILGGPFLIVDKARGSTPIPWGDDDGLSANARATLGAQFADALGALHAIDWQGGPLARFGEGLTMNNAALREVDRWEAGYRRWALRPHPMLHKLIGWLRANPPVAPRLSIIHGDYRLGNFLEVDGQITAILDWELVHLGDPHEDLAWTCLPQYRGGTALMSKLVSREDLYARHETKTGAKVDPASIHYYTLFSLLKLAVTHIAAAYAFERNGFRDMRMPAMATQIAPTLRQIEKLLVAA